MYSTYFSNVRALNLNNRKVFFKPRSKHVSLNDASQSECLKNYHISVQ